MLDAGTIDRSPPPSRLPRQPTPAKPELRGGRTDAGRASAGASARQGLRAALVSGLAGFVVGAVFWHFVGFWSFLSHVVLKGPADADGRSVQMSGPPLQQPVKVGGRLKDALRFRDLGTNAGYLQAAVGAGNCAEVRFDRATGQTGMQACSLNAAQLPTTASAGRSDRLVEASAMIGRQSPNGWTVQVQAGD